MVTVCPQVVLMTVYLWPPPLESAGAGVSPGIVPWLADVQRSEALQLAQDVPTPWESLERFPQREIYFLFEILYGLLKDNAFRNWKAQSRSKKFFKWCKLCLTNSDYLLIHTANVKW